MLFSLLSRHVNQNNGGSGIASADEGLKPSTANMAPVAFVMLLVAVLVVTHFGIQYSMRTLLTQYAHSAGMDWARHIEVRAADMPSLTATDFDSEEWQTPSNQQFTDMVNGMLAVGNIYQVDVINSDCLCDISLGTYIDKVSAAGGSKNGIDGFGTPISLSPPDQSALAHVFGDGHAHETHGQSSNKFPLDRQFALDVVENQSNTIVLHRASLPNQPSKFAEVFRPVINDGKVDYLLRIMVDLDSQYALYTRSLYIGAGAILLLIAGAFAYPTRKYLKTSRKQREADLQADFLANHDIMTGVKNRNAFQRIAPQTLQRSLKRNHCAAIYLFDVDNFKEVNDYHSHDAGDQVIRMLAQKLQDAMPEGSHLARLGGDEFAIVVGGLDSDEVLLDQILNAPNKLRVPIEGGRLHIEKTISGGAAVFPRDGSNLEELMRCADLALHAAKSAEGGHVVEYDPGMSVDFYERLDLRDEFRTALENSEIVPYYQPLVNMKTGQIEGFEALARWKHPQRGILTPYEFEEMLADNELGALVGALMLKKVVQDMKIWKRDGVPFSCVAINVGEGDLLRPGFALNIISELKQNGLRPKNLTIEITESCIFGSNREHFVRQLDNLRTAGCSIALDDFGTGYSSITQIKELPCTTVKIDKSFVNDVVKDKADQAIIRSLVELGQTLGFKLVLEGVETNEQRNLLQSLGCEIAQGYYYARPMPAEEVSPFVHRLTQSSPQGRSLLTVA